MSIPRRAPGTVPPPSRGFRPDIEGLRAIAVGLVLLYHAGLPVVSGGFAGVDVFFVISGFLITGVLVREVEKTGRVDLVQFWARRIRRLLPAATLVLALTALASRALVNPMDWERIGGDTSWAAMNLVNWRLAFQSIDYLAEGQLASPVQHYWSLAVEEQFYLVWPVLMMVLALVITRLRFRLGPTLLVGLLVITVPSLVWSVLHTHRSPADAYFVTTTRLWELGIGALTAVLAGQWDRLPPKVGRITAWAGLAAVTLTAVLFSTHTPWPGSAALLPTLGTAAVIVGGATAGDTGPVWLLGRSSMVWLGGLSYSLYLWHWPIIAIAALRWDGLSPWQGLLLAVSSIAPAWATNRFLENPIRHGSWGRNNPRIVLSVGLHLVAVGTIAGLLLSHAGLRFVAGAQSTSSAAPASVPTPGDDKTVTPYAQIVPNPALAAQDIPEGYGMGCQAEADATEPVRCTFGVEGAATKIALVGDSKALQWLPAFQTIATERDWEILTWTKSGCPWADADHVKDDGSAYPQCREWGRAVTKAIADEKGLDLVVISTGDGNASRNGREPNLDDLVTGLRINMRTLGEQDIPVIAISDTQHPRKEVYRCVAEHPENYDQTCSFARATGAGNAPLRKMVDAAKEDGTKERFIDMEPWICRTDPCHPVVGGLLTYRQGSHLTATYARALAPVVEEKVLDAAKAMDVKLS